MSRERMKIRLIKRLAERLDGVDLRHVKAGDVLNLPDREAALLIAERWATPDRRDADAPWPHDERRGESRAAPARRILSDDLIRS